MHVFSIQLIYVIVLGFRLHFLPVQVWSDEGYSEGCVFFDIVSMLFLIRSFSVRLGLIIQSINQNLFHINYNQVQHIHNNVERGK